MTASLAAAACGRVISAGSATLPDTISAISLAALTEAIRAAAECIDPDELARRCSRSRRSLSRDLRLSGMPPPAALLAWGRLLVAIELLDDRHESVERAALEVGLSGSAAFVHLCRRHIGPTPGEIRAFGGVPYALRLLRVRIVANRADQER